MRTWAVALFMVAACADPVTPRATSSPLPKGWWVVVTSSRAEDGGAVGAAWRFQSGEVDVVNAPDFVERQRTHLAATGAHAWAASAPYAFSLQEAGGALTVTIAPPGAATLTLRAGAGGESLDADRALAGRPTLDAACGQAKACFGEAASALAGPNDDHRVMAAGTSLRQCEAIVAGYAQMFVDLGRKVPLACERPPP